MTENINSNAPSALFRWTLLIIISFAMFGNYYIYDSISPLADLLSTQLNFTDADIGWLNGIYSIPNLIMVFIGGILIDLLGTRISTFLFATLCLIGAAITASFSDLEMMAVGRLVFGLGAESLIVGVTTVVGKWFKGKQLSFAFGINLMVARLGTIAAYNSPTWASGLYTDYKGPLMLAVAAGVISVAAIIIYWGMDVYASKKYTVRKEGEQDKFRFSDILSFSKSYWYLVFLCVTFYSAIFPFKTFGVKFFMMEHGVTREFGGFLISALDISAIFLTPLFGLMVDHFGKRSLLMAFGSFILFPVYVIMGYTDISLYIPMFFMGLSFSLIPAVIWPSVAMIVPERSLGTAYGLMTMVQAVGLSFFNIFVGYINDSTGSYGVGMWIFSSLSFVGLLFAFLLRRREVGPKGHGLEKGLVKGSK